MKRVAVLCSGQGFQHRDMFRLVANASEAQPIFAAAAFHLDGRDPRKLVIEEADAILHENRIAQILCCTQTLALWSVLGSLLREPFIVAGYSVGELAAWSVAGVFSAKALLDLAVHRAWCMDAATHEPSCMIAVRGLGERTINELNEQCNTNTAIVNGSDQYLIGGTCFTIENAARMASARGATKVTRLDVNTPSHTPLLQSAVEPFREKLLAAPAGPIRPDARLLSGIDGRPVFKPSDGLHKLSRQVAETVCWQKCMDSCRNAETVKFLELGPGKSLARLANEQYIDGSARSVDEFRSLSGVLAWLSDIYL